MYVAVDIGGTNGRVVAFNHGREPEELAENSFKIANDFEQDMANLVEAIKTVIGETRSGPDQEDLQGICVAVAGRLELSHLPRHIKSAGNLTDWVDQDMLAKLLPHFGCPIYFLNDAQAAGLGEATFGLQPLEDFWFVIWGSGVGGSLVRRSLTPHRYEAYPSELGHMMAGTGGGLGLVCGCGQLDCLEAHVGGHAIEKVYGHSAQDLNDQNWEDVISDMAEGLRNLLAIQPTELIVFGGGVALGQRQRLADLRHVLAQQLISAEVPQFEVACLGDRAGLMGVLAKAAT